MQKIKGIFALISMLFREKASTPGKQQRSRSGSGYSVPRGYLYTSLFFFMDKKSLFALKKS
jgi:hypothetical protein